MKRFLVFSVILSIILCFCSITNAYSQADAGADKVIVCPGTGVTIGGAGDPTWCYSWTPTTGLSNPKILHPTASPTSTTTYTLKVVGPNFSFTSTDDMKVTVGLPTGETTVGNGFNGPTARFTSTLTPATTDFSGISVSERDGGTGADGCWFVGSAMTKYLTLTGGTWPVGAGNVWGDDNLSWSGADITYYRTHPAGSPRAPCSTSLDQHMDVVCAGGNREYTHGRLIITIGVTTVSATRNGVTISKTYP